MPRKVAPKRIMVEAYLTQGLRIAVGRVVREDGKPATEEQCRKWCQDQMDEVCALVVEETK